MACFVRSNYVRLGGRLALSFGCTYIHARCTVYGIAASNINRAAQYCSSDIMYPALVTGVSDSLSSPWLALMAEPQPGKIRLARPFQVFNLLLGRSPKSGTNFSQTITSCMYGILINRNPFRRWTRNSGVVSSLALLGTIATRKRLIVGLRGGFGQQVQNGFGSSGATTRSTGYKKVKIERLDEVAADPDICELI